MRKATRKNKHLGKQILRKTKHLRKQTSRKNRKISGGYKEENKGTWAEVDFTEEEIQAIKDYNNANKPRIVPSTEIRDKLFPEMSESAKGNAAYKIQIILNRVYNGR
uniref:Uncharacterized protein n=1 Tax=viral metagenome TaxID=1070528 RepID=A0A6C0D654_9ZZZZ